MDAIRFDPSIGAEFAIDRRHSSTGGDMFADMLGDQLKKRAESERVEPAIRRRQPAERRQAVDGQAPHGRPIRPVIKHPYTLRGEARPVDEDRPLLAARDRAPEPAAPGMDEAAGSGHADRESCATAEASAAEQPDGATAEAAPAAPTATPVPGAPTQTAPVIALDPSGGMEDDAADPQSVAPADAAQDLAAAELAAQDLATQNLAPQESAAQESAAQEPTAEQPAAQDQASTTSTGDAAATPTAAGFTAALAASMDQTAAAMIGAGDTMADAGGAPQAPTTATLTTATLATLAGSPGQAASADNPAAEDTDSAALTFKLTPETPRPAETAKPRAPRAAPGVEIKAQPAINPQSAQPQAAIPAAVAAQATDPAESTAMPFDVAFDGDGVTAPGWSLHLAQGAVAKRLDFIAQLRQHLQDLPAHEQVAVNIQRALREGTGRVSIQLSPAELGKIHVKLEIDEEKRVTAVVTVEKPSTLELLQRDVKGLERALHDAGLKMDGNDLSFSLGRQDGKEFSQDMRHSGGSEHGNGLADSQLEAEVAAGPAAEVDTAAGLVNLEI